MCVLAMTSIEWGECVVESESAPKRRERAEEEVLKFYILPSFFKKSPPNSDRHPPAPLHILNFTNTIHLTALNALLCSPI